MSLADSAKKVLGRSDLPVVIVDHPVATLPTEAVCAMAERALPDVLGALTGATLLPAEP